MEITCHNFGASVASLLSDTSLMKSENLIFEDSFQPHLLTNIQPSELEDIWTTGRAAS